MCVCVCVHRHVIQMLLKMVLNTLQLDFYKLMNHPVFGLGIELEFSVREVHILSAAPFFPGKFNFYKLN